MTRRTIVNIAMVAAFTAVCAGGLAFLALGLGLEVPGKGGWPLSANFAAAEGLVTQADVDVSGVKVGRVVAIRHASDGGTIVDMRIDSSVRLRRDVQAIVRPKTQLGEKYVLLVRNRESTAPMAPDGYQIPRQQTGSAVEIDDILQQMDPQARAAFTTTLRQLGVALDGNGGNINSSLPPLADTAANFRPLAQTAEARQQNIDHILSDLTVIMQALADEQDALGGIIDNGNTAFGAMAARDQDLAGTIQQADALFTELDTTFGDLTPADRASLEKAPPTITTGRNLLALTNPDLDRLLPELLLAQVNYPSNQLNVTSPSALALAYEWESAFAQRDAATGQYSFRFVSDQPDPKKTAAAAPAAPNPAVSPGLPGAIQFLIGNGQP